MKNITVDFAQLDSKEKLEAFLEREVSSGDSVHLKNYHRELMPWAEEAVSKLKASPDVVVTTEIDPETMICPKSLSHRRLWSREMLPALCALTVRAAISHMTISIIYAST